MKIPDLSVTTQALLAVCALLGLVVVGESLTDPFGANDDAMRMEADAVALPEVVAVRYVHPSLDSFADVLERPLLMESRRLPQETVVVEAPTPTVPLQLALEGIALVGETRIAVLRDITSKDLVQLGEGADHRGWTLDSVTAETARFSRGTQIEELSLELAANNAPRRPTNASVRRR